MACLNYLDRLVYLKRSVCFDDLGVENPTQDEIRQVAEGTTAEGETIHSTWFTVTADMVEAAIWTADAIGHSYKK